MVIHPTKGTRRLSGIEHLHYADHQATSDGPIISWLPFLQRTSVALPSIESQSLAGFVQDALVTRTKAVNRGTKTEQFFVIAHVRHPAVLVEGGFLSNKGEIAKLGDPDYREQLAGAITDGILHYRDALRQRRTTLAVTGRRKRITVVGGVQGEGEPTNPQAQSAAHCCGDCRLSR